MKRKPKNTFDSFLEAEFIAIDSEGINLPDGRHRTILWLASDGEQLDDISGLDSLSIFDWLLDLSSKYKRGKTSTAIYVVYGGSYDFNQALRDLSEEDAKKVNAAGGSQGYTDIMLKGNRYGIKMIPRKYLTIAEYKNDAIARQITIYDVIGFFQSTFVSAIKQWLGKDYTDLHTISEGKDARTGFNQWEMADIVRYTSAELRALVKIMNLLRSSLITLGWKIPSWHGAGAIAGAVLKAHGAKEIIGGDLPAPALEAARHAYFGGRIELFRYGYHADKIYAADINSAYPASMSELPDFSKGKWYHLRNPKISPEAIPEWALLHIEWHTPKDLPLYPFAYRSGDLQKVIFPASGKNWTHRCEYAAAMKWAHTTGIQIKIRELITFIPDEASKPFAWIDEYYLERQAIVAESKRTGIANGAEKAIKLGLNSLYGKTAQKVCASGKPAYNNLFASGFITASTRSKIYDAAMRDPDACIMAATDGLFTSKPIEGIDYSAQKELGKWELSEYDAGLFIQSGYYFLMEGGEWKAKTRGFDKLKGPEEAVKQVRQILAEWKSGKRETYFPCTRFITLGSACRGPDWFDRWCSWYKMRGESGQDGRRLRLYPAGTKRADRLADPKPADGLIPTRPLMNMTPDIMSEIYAIQWGQDELDDPDILNDLDEYGYTE